MALDGIYLSLLRKEFDPLIDGRVDKIHQPSREELIMTIRTKEGAQKLMFSTGAGSARVHITTTDIENPKTPPMFCMLMRKHLAGGRLTAIRQDGFERILFFDFEATNEMGDPTAELSKAIMKTLEGISPVFAREAVFFAARGAEITAEQLSGDTADRLWFYFSKVRDSINDGTNVYTVLKTKEGNLKDFCFCDIAQYGALMVTKSFESPSVLLDYFYAERDSLSRIKQKANDLFKLLINTSERTQRRVQNQREELKECKDREKYRIYGDLITSNLYALEKGMAYAEVQDFYDENCPTVKIPLDKRLTPTQNAQKYYKEYRKLDTAEKKLTVLIAEGEQEVKYLDSVFDSLTRAQTEGDIAELREELFQEGYVKRSKFKGKPPKALPPIRYRSSDGYEIRVGRNNKQNDRLTCKEAEKTDLWLHVKDITGSHVIVTCDGEMPPDRTIEEAAIIAACNSKGRNSSRVDVDYTFIRNVKKPNGSKPGMVIFTNTYTITVKPDTELEEKLRV